MITLYGSSKSRASRSLVALEELGLLYRHVPLNPKRDPQERALLDTLNPNSHVPVLDDDGLIVWESMAINLYLGDRHGGPLWPTTPRARAVVYQWSVWAQTEMDRRDWEKARRSADPVQLASARGEKVAALTILDRALSAQAYLLGSEFSFADLNVAASLSQPNELGRIDWERLAPSELGLPALADWLQRCTTRPSWLKIRAFD